MATATATATTAPSMATATVAGGVGPAAGAATATGPTTGIPTTGPGTIPGATTTSDTATGTTTTGKKKDPKDKIPPQAPKLSANELERVTEVFKMYETGLREATIYPKVRQPLDPLFALSPTARWDETIYEGAFGLVFVNMSWTIKKVCKRAYEVSG